MIIVLFIPREYLAERDKAGEILVDCGVGSLACPGGYVALRGQWRFGRIKVMGAYINPNDKAR